MTKEEFLQKIDFWEINEHRFFNGVTFIKESENEFVFSVFQGGWLPCYLSREKLIQLVKDEISITDLEY